MERKSLTHVAIIWFVVPVIVLAVQTNACNDTFLEKPQELLIRGNVAYAFAQVENISRLIEFDLDDPGNITWSENSSSPSFFSGADFDSDRNMYLVDYMGGIYLMTPDGYIFYVAQSIVMNGLCYDTTTQNWYGCGTTHLYIVDVTTGAATLVGPMGTPNTIIGIACDNDGNIYGYDVVWSGHSTLYSLDKSTGQASAIGDMGYGFLYAQDPAYDRDNDILYIAGTFNDGSSSALMMCDTQSGTCTIVGNFEYGVSLDAFAIPFGSSNQYPTADFTWTPPDPLPGDTILFDASTSYDPDGYITLYEWDWDHDGIYEEAHTTPTATHVWSALGKYIVVLQVTDNGSATARKSKTITLENHPPPTPTISGPTNGTVYRLYTFSLGSITDPEGDPIYCKWDWGDGNISAWLGPYPSGQIIDTSYTWMHAGAYEIRAKLKDTYGSESNWSEPHIITIVDNQPINPSITGPTVGRVGVTYNFTIVITDPEAEMFFYFINWGDGNNTGWIGPYDSGEDVTVSHTWKNVGIYTIQVKAKDLYGQESNSNLFTIQIVELKKSLLIGGFNNESETDDLRIIDTNFLIIVPSDSILHLRIPIAIAKSNRFGLIGSSFIGGIFEAALLLE